MENGVLRASYGKSFTAPSLYYRIASYSFNNGGVTTYASGNPDLDPTTNTSWELGTEWELFNKKLRVKATYFQNEFEDLIVNASRNYIIDGQAVTIKKRVNAESADVDGIETAIEMKLPWNLISGIHYTHHWSEYTKTEVSEAGWEVAEVPTDMFNFWLGYFTDLLDASVNLRYSDSVYDDERDPFSSKVYCDYSDSFVVDTQITVRTQ